MSAAPKELTIGIDLGTTNSCMAIVEDGVVRVIPNGGHLTTPSIIAFTADGRRLVGHPAKRQAITNPEHTVIAMKRLIGRKFEGLDADPAMARQAGLVEGPHGDVRVALRDATYSLPELNGMLLQELRAAAEEDLKSPVNRAVITVPAYFNDNQRQATRDAGAIAGLEVVAILNEPTAAALAYGANAKGTRTVVVYDLGGGTFDVSVVRTSNGNLVEVLSTGGNTMLGGEDFDARIMKWLLETAKKELDVDLSGDRMALQRLKFVAETAKCALSSAEQTEINLPFIATRPNGEGVNLVRTFTRAELNFLLEDLVQQTLEECASVLWASKVAKEKIDDVLLVGGSSRLPAVQAAVTAFFGKAPSQRVNPDEAPAIGAALHADALAHGSGTVKLHDVTPQTLGILTAGLKPYPIIARNTRVPTTKTITFETRQGQANVDLLVIQGDAKKARDNTLLGKFRMSGLGKAETKIDVTFALDTDGIVQVTARDHASGRQKSIQVTARSGLTDQERVEMAAASSAYIAEKRNETERKRAEQEALVEKTKQERARAAAAKASPEPAPKAPSRKTSGKMRAAKPADSWGPPPPAADEPKASAEPAPKPAAPTRRASGKLRAPKVEPPAPPPLPVIEEPPPPKPPTRRSSGKLRAPPKLDSWGPPPPPVEQASAKPAAKADSWGPPPPVAAAKPAFDSPLAARPKESEPPAKAPAAKGPPPIPVAPVKLDPADEAALDDFTAELEQMKKKLPKRSE